MQFAIALVLLAGTWFMLRRQAQGGRVWALMPLDAGPILLGWATLLSLTARPIVSAVAVAATAAGLLLTDVVKRATLREPLVFADRAELLEVVRHPQLYLPFAGPARVLGGALAAAALVAALLWLEPVQPHPAPWITLPLLAAAFVLPTWPPLLHRLAARYRAHGLDADPIAAMHRAGFLATLIAQATLARAERPTRRGAIPPLPAAPTPGGPPLGSPIILVQLESFFDARRLGPVIPDDLLPGFDALCAVAQHHGHLAVPCWGANTVRSEFAALTGIPAAALGLDRFNPYERFARAPLPSLAWTLKAAGYRTICLHPFDKRFYGRAQAMPMLGFDEFRGPEAFPGAPRAGLYVTDEAVAAAITTILQQEGPRVFVFAITMGNHGPWQDGAAHPPLPWPLPDIPEAAPLRAFLSGLAATDRMLPPLMQAIPRGGTLAVYGDHQPSLPQAFAALGPEDPRTDYAIWHHGAPPGPASDQAAEHLPTLLLRLLARGQDAPGRA